MNLHRPRTFLAVVLLWVVLSLSVFAALEAMTASLAYISSYIGFLFIWQLGSTGSEPPRWYLRLRWIAALGFLGFLLVSAEWVYAGIMEFIARPP